MKKGSKMTPAQRQKISNAKKGIKFSEETKKKMSDAKKGIVLSPEHRQNISESLKGRKRGQTYVDGMSGSNHSLWKGFILCADCPVTGKHYYTFDQSPFEDCRKELGLSVRAIQAIRRGETWEIKRVLSTSRHPFEPGTLLTAELIEK